MSYIEDIYIIIQEKPMGSAFVASDFLDVCDYEVARKSLARLEKQNKIRRVMRGIYDRPQYSLILQEISEPDPHQIALAVARNFNWSIAPCGDTALNMLGLSTQVTGRCTYISSGPYKKYTINKITIEFLHRTSREIEGMSYMTAMVIQALKTIGKDSIDSKIVSSIGKRLSSKEKDALLSEGKQATIWMYPYIRQICEVERIV